MGQGKVLACRSPEKKNSGQRNHCKAPLLLNKLRNYDSAHATGIPDLTAGTFTRGEGGVFPFQIGRQSVTMPGLAATYRYKWPRLCQGNALKLLPFATQFQK